MDTAHAPRLGVGLTALLAVAEDAAGIGLDIGPAVEGRLHRLARGGIGLPRPVARTLGREFDFDLGRIRLHVGPEVDAVADGLNATAFCLGMGIFLSNSVVECGNAATLEILRHELTHVVADPLSHRVRCWDHEIHSKLTEAACRAFRPALERLLKDNKRVDVSGGVDGLIKGLKYASSNMDVRKRVAHVKYWDDLLFKSLPTKMGLRNVIAGEGPSHGEGLDYSDPNWQKNTRENQKEQTRHINLAIKEFRSDQNSWLDDVLPEIRAGKIPLVPFLGPVTLLEKEWIKSLGNALHVAQDRGSHREGVQGYGHDDKRCFSKFAWNPDAPGMHNHPVNDHEGLTWKRCNVAAYNKALNGSYDVMQNFLSGLGVQPGTVPSEPEQCSGLSYYQLVGGRYQCVHGHLPSPLGVRNDQLDVRYEQLGVRYDPDVGGGLPGPLGVRYDG